MKKTKVIKTNLDLDIGTLTQCFTVRQLRDIARNNGVIIGKTKGQTAFNIAQGRGKTHQRRFPVTIII